MNPFVISLSNPKLTIPCSFAQDLITGTSKSGVGAAIPFCLATVGPKLLILALRNEPKVIPVTEEINLKAPNVQAVFPYLDLLDTATISIAVEKAKTAVGQFSH